DALRSLDQRVFRGLVFAQLEIGPAQRIEIGAVSGIEIYRFLDHAESFVQLDPAVGKHVAQIVQRCGILRIACQNFTEHILRRLIFFLAFEGRAAQEIDILLVFVLGRELFRLVESFLGFRPALEAAVHLGQRDVNVAVLGSALQQRLDLLQSRIGLTHVRKLGRVHHLQAAIVGQLLNRFLGGVRGLLPLLVFAVGIDDLLVAALGILVAQGYHFPECLDGLGIILVVAINRAQTFQKHRSVVLLGLGVTVVGLLGLLEQILQDLDRLVVTPLRLVHSGHVVGHFDRVLHHRPGLLQTLQRLVESAALAVNLGHAQVGLRIFGIRVRDDLVLLEGGIGLAVVHQVLGQAANGVEIVLVELNRFSVSSDRVLVLLLLFVGVAQRRVELGGTRRVGDGTQDFSSPGGVALFVVKIGQRGDRFFRIRLQLDRNLELVFGLLQIVVQPVKTPQQKVVVNIVGLDLDDLFVLLDSQLQNVLRALSGLHIAQRTQVNAA